MSSEGAQSSVTLKLPFGMLILSWFLRNKRQSQPLNSLASCMKDSEVKVFSRKEILGCSS